MVAYCGPAAQGTVIRLVKLNVCGAPVTGASSAVVVTDGYTQVNPEPQYEDGDTFRTKNAAGRLCGNKVGPNIYVQSNITVNMCVADPDASAIITGSRLLLTNGVTGSGAAYGYNNPEAHFSLETWQPITGRGRCDPLTGAQRYLYWAWMHVWNAKVSSFNIGNEELTLGFEAMTDYPSALWGRGPGSAPYWIDSAIDTTNYIDDYLWNITTTPPPSVPTNCGAFLLT